MKVSNDTNRGRDLREDTKSRIESEDEVNSYIQNLKYALDIKTYIDNKIAEVNSAITALNA